MAYTVIKHEYIDADQPAYPLMVDEREMEIVRTTVSRIHRSKASAVSGDVLRHTHYVRRL